MAGALCALGILAFLSMRHSIHSTVDEQLWERMNVVQQAAETPLQTGNIDVLRQELDEDSELRPQSDMLQIWDDQGKLIYESTSLKPNGLLPSGTVFRPSTMWIGGLPIRVLQCSISVNKRVYQIQVAEQMQEFYEALSRFLRRLLTFAPFALLLASGIGYWISIRALSPVDRITWAAKQISARNLSARLDVPPSGDELQRLTETLNQMLERIEQAMDRITRFSADASHELRTPITVMRTRVELALRRPRTAAENHHTLEQLHAELVRSSDLLDSLMLLARADSGAEQLHIAPANIEDALKDALAQLSPLAGERSISLHSATPDHPIWIAGDRQLLQRLLLILIDNAVKYTPAFGQVSIELATTQGMATVSVKDTGIGIADGDLPHIFDRFYRADKSRTRQPGGTGLGLSIGRWIAEAHGGSIQVESQLGAGSNLQGCVAYDLISSVGTSLR